MVVKEKKQKYVFLKCKAMASQICMMRGEVVGKRNPSTTTWRHRAAPGGICNRQRELLDVMVGLPAMVPINVIQQIFALLDKTKLYLPCHLPGPLPYKSALSSQQELWLPLTFPWPSSAGHFLAFLCPLHFLAKFWCNQAAGWQRNCQHLPDVMWNRAMRFIPVLSLLRLLLSGFTQNIEVRILPWN